MSEKQDYRAHIKQARAAALLLRVVAGVAVLLGIGTFAAIAAMVAVEYIPLADSLEALVILGFGSILGGAASFASSWAVTLNADRTELALASEQAKGESSGS
jgi:predicted histidine transporter YuiF (NhaC family)